MATAITDLLTQIKTKSESSKKTYTDKSEAFENVFDKVSKNYTREENKFNSEDKKVDYQKKSDKYEQKEEDKSENTALKDNSQKNSEKENKIEENTNLPKDKPSQDSKQDKIQESKTQQKESYDEGKTAEAENKVQADPEQKNQAQSTEQSKTSITVPVASEAADILLKNLQIATAQNQVQPQIPTQTQIQPVTDKTKVQTQPQTQQVLLNINIENISQDNTTPEITNQIPKNAQTDIEQINADIKAKTPVIQANIDVKTKSDENPEQKQSIKDVLQKTILTQEMLDATNARVVSVEQNASSDNLLNKQSAQENGIKSLMDSNQQNNQNLNITDAKASFSKTIESIQSPKEISKNDILAQIHTKLTEAKDEGSTKVTIVLKPENLGKINLELINGKDGLIARMTAENVQVKELLEKNLEGLKNSLGAQGVQINEVNVKVENIEKQSNEMLNFEYQQQTMQDEQEQKDSQKADNKEQNVQNNSLDSSEDSDISEENAEETVISEKHTGRVDYKV